MKVAALGRTRFLYDAIKLLHQNGHQIALIGTCKEAPDYDIKAPDFKELSGQLQAPFFNDVKINSPEVINILKNANADIAISVNWPTIIGDAAINIFPYGILNAHAGDLPRYRGNACPNWAILEAEEKIGISIHKMVPNELDCGDIILKEFIPIDRSTRVGEIYDALGEKIPKMFLRAADGLADGSIKPQAQEKTGTQRCYPRRPSDALIRWENSAESILRLINASSLPFAGAYTYFNMEKLTIWRADTQELECQSLYIPGQVVFSDKKTGYVGIAAKDGVVVLQEIQLENNQKASPCTVIKSSRDRLGMNVEDELYLLKKRICDIT